MGEFLRAELAEGRRYLPAGQNVLRAFTFPFDRVRVLIVGQDPYPTPGHAVGLSFSVAPEVRPLPRSLDNIFTEYAADLGHPAPGTGDLTPWAERGRDAAEQGAHRAARELRRRIAARDGRRSPSARSGRWSRAAAAAGRGAVGPRRVDAEADARRRDCAAIESAHPSPLSASRGFFGSRPFSRANELLEKMGADPIDWRLP